MTGMKEGAGEDPFAEDDPADEADQVGDEADDESNDGTERRSTVEHTGDSGSANGDVGGSETNSGRSHVERESAAGGDEDRRSGGTSTQGTEADLGTTTGAGGNSGHQATPIPYKLRRDSVQDGRNRVPLFLQEDTKAAERNALRELEDRFDENVSLTDLREALILAGLEQIDDAEEQLEHWGYGMTFDV